MVDAISIPVHNAEGKVVGKATLNPTVFGVPQNSRVVAEVVRAQLANARQATAHTKTRGEVRGGGKKPWKQKGTGRARHGSIRSPIWKGGGVTFGPRNTRNYSLKVNKQVKRKALFVTLSEKVRNGKLVLLDQLELPAAKTKELAKLLERLPVSENVLAVLPRSDEKLIRASGNLPRVDAIRADSLNVVDVLGHEFLLMPTASLSVIEKTYLKTKA